MPIAAVSVTAATLCVEEDDDETSLFCGLASACSDPRPRVLDKSLLLRACRGATVTGVLRRFKLNNIPAAEANQIHEFPLGRGALCTMEGRTQQLPGSICRTYILLHSAVLMLRLGAGSTNTECQSEAAGMKQPSSFYHCCTRVALKGWQMSWLDDTCR